MSKRLGTLQERLAGRLTRKEHLELLRDILGWFEEGGAKKVKDEIRKQVEAVRKE